MRISQIKIEHLLHKQHVLNSLKEEVERDLTEHVDAGVKLLNNWLNQDYWESKEARLELVRYQDLRALTLKVVSNIILACQKPLPLVSLASMTSISDDFSKLESIQTAGEIIAVLAGTGLYSVTKAGSGSYEVQAQALPSEELERQIKVGCYLPPLMERPDILTSNTDSGYKTIKKDSLILGGKLNDHSENISLDVLNRMNAIEYTLDPIAIEEEEVFFPEIAKLHNMGESIIIRGERRTEEELAKMSVEDREDYLLQEQNHATKVEQFNHLKTMLVGKTIHFNHKVDKRGRAYSQGYHFNPQGSSYAKSCLDLATKETVTGEL